MQNNLKPLLIEITKAHKIKWKEW